MPEAFSRVVSDLADLMQKEMRLAKAEIANKITLGLRAGSHSGAASNVIAVSLVTESKKPSAVALHQN
jgi:hypothetical protein